MVNMENLKEAFAKAGLHLVEAKQPFGGNENIFGMDIQRKLGGNRRDEWFRIWPGAEDTLIQVADTDKKIGQLVLLVREKAREFLEEIPSSRWEIKKKGLKKWQEETLAHGQGRLKATDLVFKKSEAGATFRPQKVWVAYEKRRTPSNTRKYLLGVDERQLFIAQVNRNVTTVKQAHDSLKNPTVTLAEGKMPGRTVRQGEWFFLNPTKEELRLIAEEVKKHLVFKKQSIGNHVGRGGGNPHTADELVVVGPKVLQNGFSVQGRKDVFVRGKVRHRDHKTVEFSNWRKVLGNSEAAPASLGSNGVYWID
jgi:hypothetical protein